MQFLRTGDSMTVGILNFPKFNNQLRYTFFEQDNKDKYVAFDIVQCYNRHALSCYMHDTGKGFHYFNVLPLPKKEHAMIMRELRMIYDSRCPYNTLRVKANKWVNEVNTFRKGLIFTCDSDDRTKELELLKRWIENQNMRFIKEVFETVEYPLVITEEEREKGLI